MTVKTVEIVEKTTPYKAYLQVDHYLLKHDLFGGGMSNVVSRELIERGHVGAVLLYDPDLDLFVLVEQFRPAAFAAKQSPWWGEDFSPWLVEIVAGIIEEGEKPEDMCRRESVEEAGCEISDLYPIYQYFTSPGALTESVYLYCGRVDASNAGGIFGLEHEGEDIRVFTATPDETFEMLENGRIVNSMTMIAVLWFKLNGDKLRHKWLGNES